MPNSHFQDDRPITTHNDDHLGYKKPAQHIAQAVSDLSSPEGFVLGLEGEWGSGKTSFVNLIIEELQANPEPPEIIKFSPWLISTRSALLGELFQSVSTAALKIPLIEDPEKTATLNLKEKLLSKTPFKRDASKRKLSKAMRAFGGHISRLGKYAGIAKSIDVPGSGLVEQSLNAVGAAISGRSDPTLEKEKENLKTELQKLGRKLVVFIDDLDRLEPNEAAEIVRLVKAAVDFPNIVYVLCYSRKILVPSLAKALGLSDGGKYLDKIVQVTFSVPKPEDFDLRRMFKQKIEELFPEHTQSQGVAGPDQTLQRLNEVIDFEGGRTLSTPRDIARAVNALQLYAVPIIDKIDIADMTWLQLVRIRSHKMYEWIEEYMNTASVLVNGATLSGHGKQKMRADLFKIIDEERADAKAVMRLFVEMLPGVKDNYIEKEERERWELFHDLTRDNVANFIQNGRLGSPQHFRYYFALAKPSGAIEDEDFQKFLEKAENNVNDAVQHLLELSQSKRPQGGVWAEAVIDRLIDAGIENVPAGSVSGIILSLAYAMDKIALAGGVGDWGKYWVWDTAKAIIRSGLKRLSNSERNDTVYRCFAEGEALGWLTSLLRDETFAHGIVGNRQRDEVDRLLTPEEFTNIATVMRNRYKDISPNILMKTPQFTDVLFAWLQLGEGGEPEAEVKAWVQSTMADDENFIALMENMRGWSAVNGQVVYPLKNHNLEFFCNVEEVDNRLSEIAQREEDALSARAQVLIEARELAGELS